MKNLLLFLSFIGVLLTSCSGTESDEGADIVTYVKLSSNYSEILIGNTSNLKVSDNLNNDVTELSTFYINGVLNNNGKIFDPQHVGEYTITAKYGEFQSKPM